MEHLLINQPEEIGAATPKMKEAIDLLVAEHHPIGSEEV